MENGPKDSRSSSPKIMRKKRKRETKTKKPVAKPKSSAKGKKSICNDRKAKKVASNTAAATNAVNEDISNDILIYDEEEEEEEGLIFNENLNCNNSLILSTSQNASINSDGTDAMDKSCEIVDCASPSPKIMRKKRKRETKTKKPVAKPKSSAKGKKSICIDRKAKKVASNTAAAKNAVNEDTANDSLIFDEEEEEEEEKKDEEAHCNINVNKSIPTKVQRSKFTWTIHSEYDTFEEAEIFLIDEGFVLYDYTELECGHKFYFRCGCIPRDRKRHEWCARRYCIFLPSNSSDIVLQCNDLEHNHKALLEGKKRPISKEMLCFIQDLYENETTKASAVLLHIDSARKKQNLFVDEPNPTLRQLEYSLKLFRGGSKEKMIRLGDLMQWCQENSEFPNDEDGAFVFSSECNAKEEDERSFRFCVSTPRLLEITSKQETLSIDATYKLNWMGFPLIICGTVDRTKRFHPMIYACSSHEATDDYAFVFRTLKECIAKHFPESNFAPKTLIADGADAIRNAFYRAYEDSAAMDIMCFAHVLRNLRKRPFASKNNKQLMIDDIRKIQLASNRKEFALMTDAFYAKWIGHEPNFIEYFKKQWLGPHCNWFEGAAIYTPSTNNALESHNATIKRTITFRRKLPLKEFLNAMKKMTADVSKQFCEEKRIIADEPNIPRQLMMKAVEMCNNDFTSFKAKRKGNRLPVYVLPSEKCPAENAQYEHYKVLSKRHWLSFDEYIKYGYQMFWIVNLSIENWKSGSTCSCPVFFKQHACKHIIALALKEKLTESPVNANPLLLAPRRGPGRSKHASKSLMRD